MDKNNFSVTLIILIIFLAALSRMMDHPFNFTPIIAISLFAGSYLRKWWGALIPLSAMIISDYFIGFYDLELLLAVYLGVGVAYLVGFLVNRNLQWKTTVVASLTASILFFVITNFSVWLFTDWYAKTLAGIIQCFTMALPFFRNSLIGDFVYVGLIFAVYNVAMLVASNQKFFKSTV